MDETFAEDWDIFRCEICEAALCVGNGSANDGDMLPDVMDRWNCPLIYESMVLLEESAVLA